MLDINEVKQMKLPELQDFAAKIGVPKYRYMKKGELQELIIKSFVNKGETHENAEKTEPQTVIQAESKQAKPVTAKRRAQDHTESQDEHVENPATPHKPLSDGQLKALRAQREGAWRNKNANNNNSKPKPRNHRLKFPRNRIFKKTRPQDITKHLRLVPHLKKPIIFPPTTNSKA